LDAVETVVAMEEKFGVDLEDAEAMKIVSVKDAVTVFHKHKAK
jgi:acyl carrier protein